MSVAEGLEPTRDAVERLRRAGSALAPSTLTAHGWRWVHFERWCGARGRSALGASEGLVLDYLRSHEGWSWAHAKAVVGTVRWKHQVEQLPDPVSARVQAHVRRIGSEHGRVTDPLVDAMRVVDLAAAVAAMDHPYASGPTVALSAAALVAAARLGRRLPSRAPLVETLRHVRTDFRDRDVVLRACDGTVAVVDSQRDFAAWDALQRARPWLPLTGLPHAPHAADGARLELAFARSGLGQAPTLFAPAEMEPSDLAWLCAHLDPAFSRRARNRAYLVLGVLLALRHSDLVDRLTVENCVEHPDGYLLRFGQLKNGESPHRPLPHVPAAAGGHDALCPACALTTHLRCVRAAGRESGPVIATRYAGQWRPMTRQNGRLIVLAAWAAAELPAEKRIATRSLRSGGATSAYEAGLSVVEIAQQVTLHHSIDEANGYIRARFAEGGFELAL